MGRPLFGANNLLLTDTVAINEAAATGFEKVNMADGRPWLPYKNASASTELTVQTDAGVGNTSKVDYFMLAGHDLEDPADDGLGGILLEFQHSDDGIAFTTIFSVTPTTGLLIARSGDDGAAAPFDKRFYRARLTRAGGFVVSLGQMQFGKAARVPVPVGIEIGFDPDDERTIARFNRSQVGNFLGSAFHFTERRAAIDLRLVPDSFVSGNAIGELREFWNNTARVRKPFLWHWDAPESDWTDVTSERQAFFARVPDNANISRTLVTPVAKGFRNVRFQVVGLAE